MFDKKSAQHVVTTECLHTEQTTTQFVQSVNHLGVNLTYNLDCSPHLKNKESKLKRRLMAPGSWKPERNVQSFLRGDLQSQVQSQNF